MPKTTPKPETHSLTAALNLLYWKGLDHLTSRQMRVMLACKSDPQTVRGLAATLGLQKPAIVRAADRLTLEGFMVREVDPADRRSVNLKLTSAGHRLAAHFE